MRRVLLLVLYRSLWLSLFWGLGMMWKGRRNRKGTVPVPAGVQRWIGILCALWLALPGTVSVCVPYRVEISPVRGNSAAALNPAPVPIPEARVQNVSPQISLFDAAAVIWLAGAAMVFLFHIGAYLRACGRLRRWKTGEMTGYEGNRRVRIACSRFADVPMTEGLLRPVIWLPDGWGERDWGFALLHEMTHIRRGDVWVKWLLLWVKSLYWFHPLVFRFCRWMAEALEYACDEQVVREASPEQRREYCLAILEASGQGQYRMFADGFLGFAEERSKMVSRIERIMNPREGAGFTWKKKLGMCLAAVLLTGCSVVNLQVEAMAVPAAEMPEMKVSSGAAEKADDAASAPVDNQDGQDEAADAFQLDVFPCKAYEVVFPAKYRYTDKEEMVRNELIFFTAPDTKVRAVSDETVIEIGMIYFYGKYVITESDGYQMRYCHFSDITVREGDKLKQGDTIGVAGKTGAAVSDQCELRIQRKDGSPVDLSGYTDRYEGEDDEVQALEEEESPQETQAVSFQLEAFPCEAYKVVFPAWYTYKDKEKTVINELIFYANPGVEVKAISNETVIETGKIPFVGKYVITESDTCQMRYCHFEEITVNEGDVLKQGDTIGIVGVTGDATCYQCELRIQRKDGGPVDLSQYADSFDGDGAKKEIIYANDDE